jgi:hypothetical protein
MPAFNSRQYEFSDTTLVVNGHVLEGFQGIEFTDALDKEALHAKGTEPHSIQHGNSSYKGKIECTQSELQALQQIAPQKRIVLLRNITAQVIYGNPSQGVASKTYEIRGLEFTDSTMGMMQGDKAMKVSLPFIALRVVSL